MLKPRSQPGSVHLCCLRWQRLCWLGRGALEYATGEDFGEEKDQKGKRKEKRKKESKKKKREKEKKGGSRFMLTLMPLHRDRFSRTRCRRPNSRSASLTLGPLRGFSRSAGDLLKPAPAGTRDSCRASPAECLGTRRDPDRQGRRTSSRSD